MAIVEHEGWQIECDAAETGRAYARMRSGASEACGCDPCREYAARRATLLSPELCELLARLGADPAKECELTPAGRGPGGRRAVLAAWLFSGRVLARPAEEGPLRFADAGETAAGIARLELRCSWPLSPAAPESC